jgi:prevent-host-death family protein
MPRLPTSKARSAFAHTLNRVARRRERIALVRRGKVVAALVPVEDLARLEAMEDREDVAEAERAEKEGAEKGERPVPWEKVKKAAGL